MQYVTPALEKDVLQQGLPIGNGRIGALIGGAPERDFLYVSDASMWTGGTNVTLDENGQFPYGKDDFGSFVMLARLYLELEGHGGASIHDYRRELDLSNGCVRVQYRHHGVGYTRTYFASQPDDVIVIRLTCEKGGLHSGKLQLVSAHEDVTGGLDNSTLHFSGRLPNALRYAAASKVIADDGRTEIRGNILEFSKCSALTVIFSGGTDYAPCLEDGYRDPSAVPLNLAIEKTRRASTATAPTLLDTHTADYRSLFDTMLIDLGRSDDALRNQDTWQRLITRASNGAAPDPELEATYLQFGRYLTIAGSRDSLPTNLQGLWLKDNTPPWMSDYHTDINLQMNYWLPDRAGLGICFDALTRYCLSQFESWTRITKAHFNDARNRFKNSSGKLAGWTVAISTNPFGGNGWWWHPAGNAWLCNSLWQHYQYTQSKGYLQKIYPLLKGACEFWEARLIEITTTDDTGTVRKVLVDDSDWSPEHGPEHAKGITYAQELVWDLFENYAQSSAILSRDQGYAEAIKQLQQRLYLPQISPITGRLQEWMSPKDLGEDEHRHLSPLVGFFPGDRIHLDRSPAELIDGVTRLLEARGMSSFGWACAWRAICWARLRNSEKAYQLIITNLSPSHANSNGSAMNLFDIYSFGADSSAFQIDANYGTPVAMLEMLLYSRPGKIEILPALPLAWSKSGRITGVGARGGFLVDMEWRDGKATSIELTSVGGVSTNVIFNGQSQAVATGIGSRTKIL